MGGILVVSVDPCWPPVSGADLRNWQTVEHLASHAPVTVASVAARTGEAPPAPHGVVVLALSERRSADLWRTPPEGTPIDVDLPATLRGTIAALVADMRPDVAVIEGLPLHPLLPWLSGQVPWVILDLHNVESTLYARGRRGWLPWRAVARKRETAALRAVERQAGEWADRVWVCSAIEADRFAAITGRRDCVHVVPNGVPHAERVPAAMRPVDDPTARGPVLLFAGHLAYRPNAAAAVFAARKALPLVRRRLPGSRLILAGRAPNARVRSLAGDAVEIVADPPDMAAILWRSDIAVLPIAEGGGTRIKAIEAMAWGLPIVASAQAVEGLGLEDGKHYVRAESARDFGDAIAALWRDRPRFDRLRTQARELAVREYGPDAIARAVVRGLGRE